MATDQGRANSRNVHPNFAGRSDRVAVMTLYFIIGIPVLVVLGLVAWVSKRRAVAIGTFGIAAMLALALCALLMLVATSDM